MKKCMNWNKFWRIAEWVSFAYLMVYLLLKALGILHSPPAADVVAIMGVGVLIGRYIQKFDHLELDVHQLKGDVHQLKENFSVLNTKMHRVEKHLLGLSEG